MRSRLDGIISTRCLEPKGHVPPPQETPLAQPDPELVAERNQLRVCPPPPPFRLSCGSIVSRHMHPFRR